MNEHIRQTDTRLEPEGVKIPVRLIAFVAAAVVAIDQLTKFAITKTVYWSKEEPTYFFGSEHEPIPVIDGFFYIVHIANEGAAWGMLSGQTYFLSSIAVLVLAAIWFFRRQLGLDGKLAQLSVGLFAGGVLGNLIDRICYGHVIDFLDVHLPIINYRWPAFNVADCAICVGVFLYIISSFISDIKKSRGKGNIAR